jgi:putative hydrolase of the HAD superfamily
MPETPRAVLFDFGGVIADEGFHQGLHALADRHGLDPAQVLHACRETIYGSGYITGCGAEADFWRDLRARITFGDSDAVLRADILARFRLRPRMLQLVRDLRAAGIPCALLSDQTDWLDRLDARDHFYREFDRLYISYRLGKGKQDPTLFDDVVADIGVKPGEALFVDDDPGNIARARGRGLRGWLFSDETRCLAEFQPLLRVTS